MTGVTVREMHDLEEKNIYKTSRKILHRQRAKSFIFIDLLILNENIGANEGLESLTY